MIVIGNWKMNGTFRESKALLAAIEVLPDVTAIICPPATMLSPMANKMRGRGLKFSGQDCHVAEKGAYTGDVSAEMLKDAGADYVLVGHSERRQLHGDNDVQVKQKALAAQRASLTPIICIGESLAEREGGQTKAVLTRQLAGSLPVGGECLVAYEPVWAIGTGKVASPETIAETHAFITSRLPAGVKLLYGGSVNAENAEAILGLPGVDGVLVGGASLKAESFNAILRAATKQREKKRCH